MAKIINFEYLTIDGKKISIRPSRVESIREIDNKTTEIISVTNNVVNLLCDYETVKAQLFENDIDNTENSHCKKTQL